jgi:hypothetical protein
MGHSLPLYRTPGMKACHGGIFYFCGFWSFLALIF